MLRTAIMFAILSLSFTASTLADQQDDAMAAEAEAAADDAASGLDYADSALDALDRQGKHLTGARDATKAAIDQTEDFRYRGFFQQFLQALDKIIALLMFMVGGPAAGAGVFAIIRARRKKKAEAPPDAPKA